MTKATNGVGDDQPASPSRRAALSLAAVGAAGAAMLPSAVMAGGFKGSGPMSFSTAEDWIRTFFDSAETIIDYYADPFVFEDTTLFQTITDRDKLYAAFLPFANKDPNSPIGLHYFDVIRYDGGKAWPGRGQLREGKPKEYTDEEYAREGLPILLGGDYEYEEWGMMHWIWKAVHKADFLGLPAAGKSTVTRGTTFHLYRDRKIVRDFTMWDFRRVAVQLGAVPPPLMFWEHPTVKAPPRKS
jgi:steroid delta-isomerase-like uncharacterized protein